MDCHMTIPYIKPCLEIENEQDQTPFITNALEKYGQDILTDKEAFDSALPLLGFNRDSKGIHTLYAVYKRRVNAFRFLFEYVNRWLLPTKQIDITGVHSVDFNVPDWGDELFTLSQIYVKSHSESEIELIQSQIEKYEKEIQSGLKSNHSAKRILESKSITQDEKTLLVHENIIHLIQKFPQTFDRDFLSEMQHTMAITRSEFKKQRTAHHLTRIICYHYLFRRWLQEAIAAMPGKRHLSLKISPLVLNKNEPKKILSICLGLNFLNEKEMFQKSHLMSCIQHHISGISAVEGSFIFNHRGHGEICTYYIEIQKKSGKSFTASEIAVLRQGLPKDLKERIKLPLHPIFMPRNDEEIMRNILALGQQVKYVKDIPQVAVSFDEQTSDHLFFTVILVRVLKPRDKPIQELFLQNETEVRYIPDRIKNLGLIRKKYPKEAQVFLLKVAKDRFLRKDHTIDLFKARQFIIAELSKVVGEVRDFNGGMFAQQHEQLEALKESLGTEIHYSELILENFFYSLLPVGACAISAPVILKKLFTLLLEALEKSFLGHEGYDVLSDCDDHYVYIVLKEERHHFKENSHQLFAKLNISSKIIQSHVIEHGISYLGYIYPCHGVSQQQKFIETFHKFVHKTYSKTAALP